MFICGRNGIRVFTFVLADGQTIRFVKQVCGVDGDIAVRGLDAARAVNDFSICRPCCILLHPQVVSGQDIAIRVMNAVSKQLQVVTGVNQRGIEQGACGSHRQTARRAGEAVYGDIAPRGKLHIAARLK